MSLRISIVMAIYNVEEYLDEAIQSIINQTVDFQKNVELILVNDGSPDNSGEICRKYQKEFPLNVKYIEQENAGVSVARNRGLEVVTGDIVNFMDPDDVMDLSALEKVKDFFNFYKEINLVCLPLHFFEAQTGEHMLNYKFKRGAIIDVERDFDCILLSSSSAFIRSSAFLKRRFPVGQKFGEDASVLTDIILENGRYGVLPNTIYWYRKRYAGNSALQGGYDSYDYFIPFIKDYLLQKLNKYSETEVPKYLQFLVMYDLQWRLRLKHYPEFLKETEFEQLLQEVLLRIDDDIINAQRYLNYYQKKAILRIKREGFIENIEEDMFFLDDGEENQTLFDATGKRIIDLNQTKLHLSIIEARNGSLKITGYCNNEFTNTDISIICKFNGKEIVVSNFPYPDKKSSVMGKVVHKAKGFIVEIPIEDFKIGRKIRFFVSNNGKKTSASISFDGQASKFSNNNDNYYYILENKIIMKYSKKKNYFYFMENSITNILKNESKIFKMISKKKGKKQALKISGLRIIARVKTHFKNRKTYLFMDRIDKADDNAEVLYQFYQQHAKNKDINFVIDRSVEDSLRLKHKNFKLINYHSKKHLISLLTADKLISSHADKFIYQLPYGLEEYVKDMKDFRYIFLQHGITKDNMSHWLKKTDKNFALFITAGIPEYKSINDSEYQFINNEVVLTGFPRYDRLSKQDTKKQIVIMPTWRQGIVADYDDTISARPYFDKFKESQFYMKWNKLLNNENLRRFCKANGYTLVFVPHPSIRQQLSDFDLADIIVPEYDESYSKLLKDADLLITDYSSVFFDFSYMRKPIAYYHFDNGNWDNESGYFDYHTDGFGPIFDDDNNLVNYIKSLVTDNELKIESKYLDRINSFFKFDDLRNSQRVHDAIEKL
ncbi:hypothetical protein RU97_GL002642 [Enterococcus canis]|uniref:Glycosyltransferase 2-like domain-containing protein n=1 Tax=Enterococcus canis TaxID=214095 RepID=A0A1L8RCI1_9ENTE|nr:CDP-glycerol glycerophosphotransferase family protein [Enterococcus canis]OJG17471.1 hypothetical protein RU97_GL002642 [Enterococcus canis]